MSGATPVEPRLAATVILMRDGPAGPEIFMVVRHHEIDFASGALVFPGGRVESSDHRIASDPASCPPWPGVPEAAMALRVAAIRETFEECGVLLARPAGSAELVGAAHLRRLAERAEARPAGDGWLAAVLETERLVLAPDLLTPWAHWITPVVARKRYDTHFFLAHAPADQVGVHDGLEAVDSVWITAAEALRLAGEGRYKLVFATELNLRKLGRHADVAAAMAAARSAPVVTVVPEVVERRDGGGRRLRLPLAADYGGELFDTELPPAG